MIFCQENVRLYKPNLALEEAYSVIIDQMRHSITHIWLFLQNNSCKSIKISI